jgi:hypothetical protein
MTNYKATPEYLSDRALPRSLKVVATGLIRTDAACTWPYAAPCGLNRTTAVTIP